MAITVNYEWPVAVPGSTTPAPPTQAPPTVPGVPSSVRFNQVTALLTGDGAATSVTITHNLQMSAAELAIYWPEVRFEPIIANPPSGFWVEARAANTVTVGFTGTSPSAFGLVRIARPDAPVR